MLPCCGLPFTMRPRTRRAKGGGPAECKAFFVEHNVAAPTAHWIARLLGFKPSMRAIQQHVSRMFSLLPAFASIMPQRCRRAGANGCIRLEEIHNAAANSGLAFQAVDLPMYLLKEHLKTLPQPEGWVDDRRHIPFSHADLYQFAGLVSVASVGGANLTESFKWGRSDAPWVWCQGEILESMPDHSGGHKSGWHKHGAGKVAERLRTTFDAQKEYFEENLGLKPEEWVALLGAHSIGKVAGLMPNHNKVAMTPFDRTPTVFDNQYYKDLELASASALLSLCPQGRRPGDACSARVVCPLPHPHPPY
jgi:catalase (peroxidase I)